MPLHLLAAAALAGAIWALAAARRRSPRPGWATQLGLLAVGLYALASLVDEDLFGIAAFAGVFLGPTLGGVLVVVVAIRLALTARSDRPAAERTRGHARSVQWLLWGGLLLGIPASVAYAWLRGANPFCF